MTESRQPSAPLRFAPPRVERIERGDGGFILRSREPLAGYARCVGDWLRAQAQRAPQRLFLAQRDGDGWRTVTYAQALAGARAIGSALLTRRLSEQRPVVILSDNSLDHALLALGAQYVGIPYAPVSPAYSLLSGDHAKLRAIFDLLTPGLVFADDAARFGRALAAVAGDFEVVASQHVPPSATPFAALAATPPSAAAEAAAADVGPDHIAKILFTSGSTGEPKGVINTHRMLTANQQMILQCWPFLQDEPPVLLDWLPWNHTFGGNHNFNMVLANGGTLYIDEGKPAPGLIEKTVANLRSVSPTLYFNVPRGFDMLLPYLERDADLAQRFFARLKLTFYAGAALPQNLWERLQALASALGKCVAMTSAWGATETAPLVTSVHFP
ncbi:MAG: AMP-binding protein, partial [Sutterellaceae bacterium]|nr:AMP-binding protein [Burkholderiaceae bacterium]MDW8430213.1 AMP-binding protein [Sutterellaceae bacterium]